MRKVIALSLFISSASCLIAQDFDLGVKGGVNYSTSIISNVIGSGSADPNDIYTEPGVGIVFGGFGRLSVKKFSLQSELLFSQEKTAVKLNDIGWDDIQQVEINKVDIPVLLGYKFLKIFTVKAGPVLSNIRASNNDPLFDFNNLTVGYQAGVGFDISRLTFDARYEGNLSKLENTINTDGGMIQFDERKNIFQFTVGYKLFD